MASPAVIYDNALPNGANGAPRASHNAAVAIPDTVPSVETLEAYQAQASGRELTPEQELLVLHQQKRAEELAAAQGIDIGIKQGSHRTRNGVVLKSFANA